VPQWGWIIIFAIGGPSIIAVIWTVLKRGGSIGIGKNTLTIPGEAMVVHGEDLEDDGPMGRALNYVPENIGQIHHMIYGHFLKLVKAAPGVVPNEITTLEESVFARALIKIASSLGNGSHSIQMIIQTHITRKDFVGKDLESYVIRIVVPRVIDRLRETINSEYDSVTHYKDGSTKTRSVTQVQFVDMLLSQGFRESLVRAILPFFRWAQSCLDGECAE